MATDDTKIRWTPGNTEILHQLFDLGYSDEEIGKNLGCSGTQVKTKRWALRLSRSTLSLEEQRKREELDTQVKIYYDQGMTDNAIAITLGISHSRVYSSRTRQNLEAIGHSNKTGGTRRKSTSSKYNPVRQECLRCGQPFDAWDKVRNRLCPTCSNISAGII